MISNNIPVGVWAEAREKTSENALVAMREFVEAYLDQDMSKVWQTNITVAFGSLLADRIGTIRTFDDIKVDVSPYPGHTTYHYNGVYVHLPEHQEMNRDTFNASYDPEQILVTEFQPYDDFPTRLKIESHRMEILIVQDSWNSYLLEAAWDGFKENILTPHRKTAFL